MAVRETMIAAPAARNPRTGFGIGCSWWFDSNIRIPFGAALCECLNQRTTSKLKVQVELWI
jgi:hypothetical protein